MARSVIIDAVSEMCRNRSVTHILMSQENYVLYSHGLTQKHLRSGVKYSICHGCGIIVVDGLTDELLLTFNAKMSKEASNILDQARSEEWKKVMELLDELLDQEVKWIHYCVLPEVSDEAAG